MTKQLEALIARILKLASLAEQTNINESSESWVAYLNEVSPTNVRELIAALEQANCERNKAYRQASAARIAFDEQYQLRDTAERRLAEMEASPPAVKLPVLASIHSNWSGEYLLKSEVIEAIRAAGGTVSEGE